jgi:hypothetical protein
MSTEIIIDVAPDGQVKVEVKGVKGRGCKALTKDYEESLGKKVSSIDTKEAYEQERIQSHNRS